MERDTAVECRLTTKCKQDAIGTFLLDDALDELGRHGLEIHRVGYGLRGRINAIILLRCLHGGDIWVDEHRVYAFFLESLQRLCATVVELACLPNLQGTAAKEEHFFEG